MYFGAAASSCNHYLLLFSLTDDLCLNKWAFLALGSKVARRMVAKSTPNEVLLHCIGFWQVRERKVITASRYVAAL